jgi:hypothetical protein
MSQAKRALKGKRPMDMKRIFMVSGAALLSLTSTALAGPMSVASSKVIAPPQTQTAPVSYRHRHHYAWHVGTRHASCPAAVAAVRMPRTHKRALLVLVGPCPLP